MINQELSEIFNQMGDILEFLGDPQVFRIRALHNVAISLREVNESVERLAKEKRLRDIPGVGEGIAKKIEEYIKTGKILDYEKLKKMVPAGFFDLIGVPSLGPKKVRALYEKLGVTNGEELKKAIAEGKVQELDGFGEKSAQKILEGLAMKSGNLRRSIGEVFLKVEEIISLLKKSPDIDQVVPAGSFRRTEATVGDIDILATGKNPEKIMKFFLKQPFVGKVISEGDTKISVYTHDGLQIDIRVVLPNQFGSALQYFTGSKLHNVHLRTYAKNKGFKLSEYGFFKGTKVVASKTEEECYASIGMQYIPPEIRTDAGEIEAAIAHKIPKLIEVNDIRGDLHAHTTWSDGKNSIEEMAAEGHRRGYEYIALTDHSPRLAIARGLSLERLNAKKKELDRIQQKFKIKILFGTEVDILADGTIDYPDDVLKKFDIVVASIHSNFKQDNTDRMIKAMQNPYVHIIGHPSGRMINKRPGYHIDYEKIFKAASETNTALEINAQYLRLDLQDIYIREAKRWKCHFSIDSDAHSTQGLWLMDLGVRWARRGWAEKNDVINTRSLKELKNILK